MHGVAGPSIIGDHTQLLKVHKLSFVGSQLVDWLLEQGDVKERSEGVRLAQTLLHAGFIEHVASEHEFKDKNLFYRFCCDHKRRMFNPGAAEPTFTVVQVHKGKPEERQRERERAREREKLSVYVRLSFLWVSVHFSPSLAFNPDGQLGPERKITVTRSPAGFGFVLVRAAMGCSG